MRRRNKFSMVLTGLGALTGLALAGCNDWSTGQDTEPEGPLQITKLILFDNSRDVPTMTDTSAPSDCKSVAVDDTSDIGKACNGPFKDKYNTKNSPPTTDVATKVAIPGIGETGGIQVIFNKIPFKVGSNDLETRTAVMNPKPGEAPFTLSTDQTALTLECVSECSGVPAGQLKSFLTGTELSADPDGTVNGIPIAFGPAIRFYVDTAKDALASLEPKATYRVAVNAGLADRNGNKVDLGAASKLLTFTVAEPLRVLQAGLGDGNDEWVYTNATPSFEIGDVPSDGALVLTTNAPLDKSLFKAGSVTVTVGGKSVPAKLTTQMGDGTDCDPGNGRMLFIFPDNDPDPAKRSWGAAGDIVVTIKAADVRNLAQDATHSAGKGKASLAADVTVKAKNTGKAADAKYGGILVGDLCP